MYSMMTMEIEKNPELEEDRPRRKPRKKNKRLAYKQRCAYCCEKVTYYSDEDPDDAIEAHVMRRECRFLEITDPARGIEIKDRYRLWGSMAAKRDVAHRR